MSVQVKVPAVGESISEVTIAKWLKNEGDHVEQDEIICELESDKATFELPAETAGTLKIIAKEGDTIAVGDVICEISGNGEAKSAPAPAKSEQPAAQPAAAKNEAASPQTSAPAAHNMASAAALPDTGNEGAVVEMKVPAVGESITEVTISNWIKKDGDHVEVDMVLCELESDKATFELPAEAAGTLRIVAQEGETLSIGGLICRIERSGGDSANAAAKASGNTNEQPVNVQNTQQLASSGNASYVAGHAAPAAAKIMAEKGLSSGDVQGSGRDGRITKEDAMNAQKPAAASAPAAQKPASAAPAQSSSAINQQPTAGTRGEHREKMSNLRKTVARRLVSVKNETAMLTTFNEVDMKPIMDIRAKYKDKFKEKHSVGLGFMSFFTKACCVALQEFPAVNARLEENEIVYNDFCDVSIAVSAPKGLVVPVIRNAEQMSFEQVEKEVVRLATKARDNKLTIEEMTGGTFTITNGGVFGSMMSTPIINAPQSAILGMHNIVERPVAINGQVEIRPMMYLALSYDHRIIDGRESVSFLVRVKQLLEDPTRLLLGV